MPDDKLELAQYAACLLTLKTGKSTHIYQTPSGEYLVTDHPQKISMDGEPLELVETVEQGE